jgi:hypothetical protein
VSWDGGVEAVIRWKGEIVNDSEVPMIMFWHSPSGHNGDVRAKRIQWERASKGLIIQVLFDPFGIEGRLSANRSVVSLWRSFGDCVGDAPRGPPKLHTFGHNLIRIIKL